MRLAGVSPAITTRFIEVQEFLSFIRQIESQAAGTFDAPAVIMARGLFYVHLYGAFEFSVNRIVLGAVQAINQEQLPHNKIADSLGALALDGAFNAVSKAGRDTQWNKRLKLINLRFSNTIAQIHDGCVDFQNIWFQTLQEIFEVFGIDKSVMYDVTKSGYVRELVDTRNAVAHGRDSPLTKGRAKRSDELQRVHDAIRSEAFHIYDCFEDYLKRRMFEV